MITDLSASVYANFTAPVRRFVAEVELFEGSTRLATYSSQNRIKNFTIDRVGEDGKFFGFGVCHRLNIHLIDTNRELNITTANSLKVYFSAPTTNWFPTFYVSEVHRDENTNELSITAYDKIYKASRHTVEETEIEAPYTIEDFTRACLNVLSLGDLSIDDAILPSFTDIAYAQGANFEGSENIRDALNRVAEATQTIYYIDRNDTVVFKRLDIAGEPVLTISKEDYITLESGANRRLSTITHATELGDNISASLDASGSTQYVRNNPFWDLREDTATLVENALAVVGGMTINQFNCSWRGNPALEIGDKIALITKNNSTAISYVLNDNITYDGFLKETTQWKYSDDTGETASNPSTLGEALNQTFARVDKANKEIELVASETSANSANISQISLDTNAIGASVQEVKDALSSTNESIGSLSSRVDAVITAEDVSIQIQNELANGVDSITTSTGFTFNEEGLTVSKSGSEMATTITEDGMTVYRDDTPLLVANNVGVEATNLQARNYLVIGSYSRFQDFDNRTGCFWIGG